jgi:predicted Zn-dependent peptidase
MADLVQAALFEGQPLGAPVAGTPEAVQAASLGAVVAHLGRQWSASNLVLTVVGRIGAAEANGVAEQFFGALPLTPTGGPTPVASTTSQQAPPAGRTVFRQSSGVQSQFRLTFLAPSLGTAKADQVALFALTSMTGFFSTGRLVQELRNRRGLAYLTESLYLPYRDTGAWYAGAGVDPQNLELAVQLVGAEVQRLRDEAPASEEVTNAVSQLAGSDILANETNAARAARLAREEIRGEDSVEQFVESLRSASPEDVQRVAQNYLDPERSALVVVGPTAP